MKPKGPVQIELLPLGRMLSVDAGTPLHDLLFVHGVEFPCGGQGRCKGCRVKVLQGSLPPTAEDLRLLTPAELEAGWRLACRSRADGNLQLELAQWEIPILADDTTFAFKAQAGLGVAVDVGTTTIVAQLLDLSTAEVLAVRSALNTQARHGADIMSRIEFARQAGQESLLTQLIRQQIGNLIAELVCAIDHPTSALEHVVLVGNTAMHHLFCGLDVEPLAHSPFEPRCLDLEEFSAAALGWDLPYQPRVRFLPCLGGFVGSDLLAGILATRLHESDQLEVLMDLGTNGEIVLGNRERILCASTAAGPAFEGARISMGMRAATGAIAAVTVRDGQLDCHVLGEGAPRGLCGSGLVDAVAAGLDLGWIEPSGRMIGGPSVTLRPPVELTQSDVRELQLAKGAIAAGLELLLRRWGVTLDAVRRVYLAGAFGNYINRHSARRIGLLRTSLEQIHPAGNTALLGAKLALFGLEQESGDFAALRAKIEHVPLNEDPQFHEVYVGEMGFPHESSTPSSHPIAS